MNIDALIDEFNIKKRIAERELRKRFYIPHLRHALFLRKIVLYRYLMRDQHFYELIPLDRKIIRILREKGTFSYEWVRNRFGLRLSDLKSFLNDFDYELRKKSSGKFAIARIASRNPVPCMQDIEICGQIEQCYLSYKCKAAQKFLEKQQKIKEKING